MRDLFGIEALQVRAEVLVEGVGQQLLKHCRRRAARSGVDLCAQQQNSSRTAGSRSRSTCLCWARESEASRLLGDHRPPHLPTTANRERERECVCERERECVCERERERERERGGKCKPLAANPSASRADFVPTCNALSSPTMFVSQVLLSPLSLYLFSSHMFERNTNVGPQGQPPALACPSAPPKPPRVAQS